MSKWSIVKSFGRFLMVKKAYWLIPLILVVILFGMLFLLGESSVVAPFIYSIF